VAVIDNDRDAEALDELAARPGTRIVHGGPGGFAGGANLGARTSDADVVIFVNPDAVPAAEVLAALASDVLSDPGLVACGPTLLGPDGLPQIGTGGYEPTVARAVVTAAGLASRFPGRGLHARPVLGQDMGFEWISGACLAVRRSEFLGLGGFDERLFVYCEDVALGRAIRAAGLRERHRYDLTVPHEGKASGGGSSYGSWLKGIALRDYLALVRPAWQAWAIRLVMAAGILARVPVNYFRSGDRDSTADGLAYVRGLLAPASVLATRGR
jgi:GT2 family glycosyltransferase